MPFRATREFFPVAPERAFGAEERALKSHELNAEQRVDVLKLYCDFIALAREIGVDLARRSHLRQIGDAADAQGCRREAIGAREGSEEDENLKRAVRRELRVLLLEGFE